MAFFHGDNAIARPLTGARSLYGTRSLAPASRLGVKQRPAKSGAHHSAGSVCRRRGERRKRTVMWLRRRQAGKLM